MVERSTIRMSCVGERSLDFERTQHLLTHQLLKRFPAGCLQDDRQQIDVEGRVVEIRSGLVKQLGIIEILESLRHIGMTAL
ncbi:MAG: hypothetical protein U5R48_09945 [Gammaproteobacteria bacterium]|nr:hypothetical protein [Gammaproteobacteria bacterium]